MAQFFLFLSSTFYDFFTLQQHRTEKVVPLKFIFIFISNNFFHSRQALLHHYFIPLASYRAVTFCYLLVFIAPKKKFSSSLLFLAPVLYISLCYFTEKNNSLWAGMEIIETRKTSKFVHAKKNSKKP